MSRRTRYAAFDVVFGLVTVVLVAWVALTLAVGALSTRDALCASCHTMKPYREAHADSAHRSLSCSSCHGAEGSMRFAVDGLAMQRRALSALLGVAPVPSDAGDRGCRSCHSDQLRAVVSADGLRVRHIDFSEARCSECHAGVAHAVAGRTYAAPEMDSCIGCHEVSSASLDTCELCHSETDAKAQRVANTSWRATHGENWRTAHGMGELKSCHSCHAAAFCADCHGTPLPHPAGWAAGHGVGVDEKARAACETCHARRWCDECHGTPMPHASGFIVKHGAEAKRSGSSRCVRCHAAASCDACHAKARHADVEGLHRVHEVQR